MDPSPISREVLAQLAQCDSCSIANAVDASGVRLANEGFCDDRLVCRNPGLPPMVGTVVTLKVRSADPSMKQGFYLDQPDWWERLDSSPTPRVLAIEDIDDHPGRGSLVGPVHACILKAMGFVGVITNGAIRGRRRFEEIGLQAFSGHLSPGHAFSHVIELGAPIVLADLPLRPGDLIHGDENGIVKIPVEIAEQVAKQAKGFHDREASVCDFIPAKEFSPAALKRRLGIDASRR